MPLPDPTEEHKTSQVFQPFPRELVQRLSPRTETPPPFPGRLSPLPSESDISERRYSDVSNPPETEADLLHQWSTTRQTAPSPPPQLRRDRPADPPTVRAAPRKISNLAKHAPNRPGTPPPTLAQKKPLPVLSAIPQPPIQLAHPPKARFNRTSPSYIPLTTANHRRVASHMDPAPECSYAYHSTPYVALPLRPIPSVPIEVIPPPRQSDPPKERLLSRRWWRQLGARGRARREGRKCAETERAELAAETFPKDGRDWRCESLRLLRLRGEREGHVSMPPSSGREMEKRRGHGRRPRSSGNVSRKSFSHLSGGGDGVPPQGQGIPIGPGGVRMVNGVGTVFGDSPSVGSLSVMGQRMMDGPSVGSLPYVGLGQRERVVGFVDGKREASSFAGYRGRMLFTTEGSSVSSSEDTGEDRLGGLNGPESGHLYLSRRQLRAMQYK